MFNRLLYRFQLHIKKHTHLRALKCVFLNHKYALTVAIYNNNSFTINTTVDQQQLVDMHTNSRAVSGASVHTDFLFIK